MMTMTNEARETLAALIAASLREESETLASLLLAYDARLRAMGK